MGRSARVPGPIGAGHLGSKQSTRKRAGPLQGLADRTRVRRESATLIYVIPGDDARGDVWLRAKGRPSPTRRRGGRGVATSDDITTSSIRTSVRRGAGADGDRRRDFRIGSERRVATLLGASAAHCSGRKLDTLVPAPLVPSSASHAGRIGRTREFALRVPAGAGPSSSPPALEGAARARPAPAHARRRRRRETLRRPGPHTCGASAAHRRGATGVTGRPVFEAGVAVEGDATQSTATAARSPDRCKEKARSRRRGPREHVGVADGSGVTPVVARLPRRHTSRVWRTAVESIAGA